jgi:hypothetical protein
MSVETLAEALGDVAHRKGFLARVGAASVGLLGLAGVFPERAHAICYTHGCELCNCPTSCGPLLECAWCWLGNCHNHSGAWLKHYCCEGYGPSGDCSLRCPAYCSYWTGNYGC